jgi:HEAT repeat protein
MGERNRAADAALLEAMPTLDSSAQRSALDLLLRRDHMPTLLALVKTFQTMEEPLRGLIRQRAGALHSAIRAGIGSSAMEDRSAAIELIVAGGDTRLAYLLSDALGSACPRTREIAALSLHDLTRRTLEAIDAAPPSDRAKLAACADHLGEALRAAVLRWETHFQPKALEAALWLIDRVEPAIAAKLREPHAKIAHMLGEMLSAAADPWLAAAVLRALAMPELRSSASRAVKRANTPRFMRALLHEAWVLADLDIDHGLRWVHEGPWLDAWAAELYALDDSDAARLPQMLGCLGGVPERKMQRFRAMLDAPRAAVRREVLWRLVADSSEAATTLLQLLASRTEDELARVADRECRRRQRRAGGTGVTKPAEDVAGTTDGNVPPDRRSAAQRVREKLNSQDALDRGKGLRMARKLALTSELAQEFYRLANDRDRVVRAAAISALTDLPGPTTTRILRAALNDPDDRVQANAIEALDRLNIQTCMESIRPKLGSDSSRVRANAVRALLRAEVREAGGVLLDMLEDPSQAQRISALWVIERLRLRSVLHRVMEMSRADADERVRRRAARILAEFAPGERHRQVWPSPYAKGEFPASPLEKGGFTGVEGTA